MIEYIKNHPWIKWVLVGIVIAVLISFLIPSISKTTTLQKQLIDEKVKTTSLQSTIDLQKTEIKTLEKKVKQHQVITKPDGTTIVTDTDTDLNSTSNTITQMKAQFQEQIDERDKRIATLEEQVKLEINPRQFSLGPVVTADFAKSEFGFGLAGKADFSNRFGAIGGFLYNKTRPSSTVFIGPVLNW